MSLKFIEFDHFASSMTFTPIALPPAADRWHFRRRILAARFHLCGAITPARDGRCLRNSAVRRQKKANKSDRIKTRDRLVGSRGTGGHIEYFSELSVRARL